MAYSLSSSYTVYSTNAKSIYKDDAGVFVDKWSGYEALLNNLIRDEKSRRYVEEIKDVDVFSGGDEDGWFVVKQYAIDFLQEVKKTHEGFNTIEKVSRLTTKAFVEQIDDFACANTVDRSLLTVDENKNLVHGTRAFLNMAYLAVRGAVAEFDNPDDHRLYDFAYKILSKGGFLLGKRIQSDDSLYVLFDYPEDSTMGKLLGSEKKEPEGFSANYKARAQGLGTSYVTYSGGF